MIIKSIVRYFVLLTVIIICYCQKEVPTQTAGGGTDAEHSFTKKVTGRLLYSDSSVAVDAEVNMISHDYTPSLGGSDSNTVTVYTDSLGVYSIIPKSAGIFNIAGIKDDKGVFIDSIPVVNDSNDVVVADAFLLCNGTITGILHMVGVNDTNQVKADIYIPGTMHFNKPIIGGEFSISSIPPGEYQFIIVPSLDDYSVKVMDILVNPGQVINLDTIYIGISQIINTSPIASFSAIPETGYVNEEISFSALDCSDKEDVNPLLYVIWDFNDDGVWDTEWSLSKNASMTYGNEGLKRVKLVVMDTDGLKDTCIKSVLVKPKTSIRMDKDNIYLSCDEGSQVSNVLFRIWNPGTGEMDYTITNNASWLVCNPNSGTCSSEEDIISLIYDVDGLAPGDYYATIKVDSDNAINSPESIMVELIVHPEDSNRVVDSLVFESGTQCYGLEHDGNYLWISDDNGYKIRKVNPLNGAFITSYDQTGYVRGVRSTHDLAYDESNNNLYCQVSYGGYINLVDLNPGFNMIDSLIPPVDWIHGVDFDGHYLWINEHDYGNRNYLIHKCDPDDAGKVATFTAPHDSGGSAGIAWADGYLWFCNAWLNRYYKIDISKALLDGHCENALVDSFDCDLNGRLSWDGNYLWVNGGEANKVYKLRVD